MPHMRELQAKPGCGPLNCILMRLGGAIVCHDDLKSLVILGCQSCQNGQQGLAAVVGGDDYGD